MKSLLFMVGTIIIIIYVSPLYKSKINIGNIFGIILGLCFILIGNFYKDIIRLSSITSIKITIIFLSIIITVFFFLFFYTLYKIIKASKNTATNEEVVIVLGCRVKGTIPSKALSKRCKSAYNHLSKNKNAIAILSGGQGADEDISEAQCMKNILVNLGVNEDKLILEEKSTSTEENIIFSKEIIDKLGLSNKVAIATSEYHLYRALEFAKGQGLNASSLSAKSIPILRVSYFTREVFGIWWQKINRYIS